MTANDLQFVAPAAMGNAQSLHDKILENEKCSRMLRLRIRRLESMLAVLSETGPHTEFLSRW